MKKFLISGCSFSMTQKFQNRSHWIPWSDIFIDNYPQYQINNIANASNGQSKIIPSVVKEIEVNSYIPDFVIIQLSAFSRGYSINQEQFVERLLKEDLKLIGSEQDLVNESIPHRVSDKITMIEDIYHINSFVNTLLLKQYLNSKKIPYLMFHGWQQITENNKFSNLWKDKIYDQNFWRFEEFGGMSEYIIDKIGEKKGIIRNDFHPTTEGHVLFLNDIIIPYLYERKIIDEIKKIDNKRLI